MKKDDRCESIILNAAFANFLVSTIKSLNVSTLRETESRDFLSRIQLMVGKSNKRSVKHNEVLDISLQISELVV